MVKTHIWCISSHFLLFTSAYSTNLSILCAPKGFSIVRVSSKVKGRNCSPHHPGFRNGSGARRGGYHLFWWWNQLTWWINRFLEYIGLLLRVFWVSPKLSDGCSDSSNSCFPSLLLFTPVPFLFPLSVSPLPPHYLFPVYPPLLHPHSSELLCCKHKNVQSSNSIPFQFHFISFTTHCVCLFSSLVFYCFVFSSFIFSSLITSSPISPILIPFSLLFTSLLLSSLLFSCLSINIGVWWVLASNCESVQSTANLLHTRHHESGGGQRRYVQYSVVQLIQSKTIVVISCHTILYHTTLCQIIPY